MTSMNNRFGCDLDAIPSAMYIPSALCEITSCIGEIRIETLVRKAGESRLRMTLGYLGHSGRRPRMFTFW